MRSVICGMLLGFAVCAAPAAAAACPPNPDLRFRVPESVSRPAAEKLCALYAAAQARPPMPPLKTLEDFDRMNAVIEAQAVPASQQFADAMHVRSVRETIGGVSILRIVPPNARPGRPPLVYIHGGGYIVLSARSTQVLPALLGKALRREVISIDYTLAPRGNVNTISDQVIAVWRALLASGHDPQAMGLFGDSAGGNMAAAFTLKMRDQAVPLPGALYLLSPGADLTMSGDTVATLGPYDPMLQPQNFITYLNAYAAGTDVRHPYISPLFGDYSKAFPPTLIQAGTRELLLSEAVRQYQAIRGGGHEAVLDLYEGMPHVFPAMLPNTPESDTAISRAATFFEEHLRK
ncbi:alpha/beta hydrolase [Sphingobium sp. 3R8]|uniref:alpha/beta hydrolase n=1 Tax=Sphingobium sp. 3R8 TaxID=2874921 RepID=UPI001CCB0439|nr:alpha/beta hydrolase [Sphingobium sp. 3R8]MBZ9647577.1 alpha/beta hydrolase [Sphingobium sp. 3R8]